MKAKDHSACNSSGGFMKVKIEVDLRPFTVPNFVMVNVASRPMSDVDSEPKYSMADLDVDTLERLCSEFKASVFKKAGKQPRPVCESS